MKQLFFIEGKLLGETVREKVDWNGQWAPPVSALFFCAVCGEVFAKCPVVLEDGTNSQWQSYRKVCARHGGDRVLGEDPPGSLWLSWDRDFLKALPLEVMLREFELHLKARGLE